MQNELSKEMNMEEVQGVLLQELVNLFEMEL
jgi:hypothetical protein